MKRNRPPAAHWTHVTADGKTVGENIANAHKLRHRAVDQDLWTRHSRTTAGIAVLRGNLAPRGAVIKPSAATPRADARTPGAPWCSRTATTSTHASTMKTLDVDEELHSGAEKLRPQGLPRHGRSRQHAAATQGAAQGHHRHACASATPRMSGTAYGTVVLHTAPEAAAGGPLAVVRNGDMIEVNVPQRRLQPADQPTRSWPAGWRNGQPPPPGRWPSAYWRLYIDHVLQADQGADLDFLVGRRGRPTTEDNR